MYNVTVVLCGYIHDYYTVSHIVLRFMCYSKLTLSESYCILYYAIQNLLHTDL